MSSHDNTKAFSVRQINFFIALFSLLSVRLAGAAQTDGYPLTHALSNHPWLFTIIVLGFILGCLIIAYIWRIKSQLASSNVNLAQSISRQSSEIEQVILKQQSAHQALNVSEARLRSVMDNVTSCIITTDNHGNMVDINTVTERMFGYHRNELIGQNFRILMPAEFALTDDLQIDKARQTGITDLIGQPRETSCLRKNGEEFPAELTLTEIMTNEEHLYIAMVTDITNRKQTEKALTESQKRFVLSQQFANIGTWDWNIVTGDLYWSDQVCPLFGYPTGALETTYGNFLNAVHPDDRQSVIDAVNSCVDNGTDYDIEHRCVWPDGTVRWMLERGDVIRDDCGTPLHMLGVVTDITNRKILEQDLGKQQKLLAMLRNAMNIFVTNPDFIATTQYLLDGLLELTDSDYGFTGEILTDNDGQPYLKTHAISNIAWDDNSREFYQNNAPQGMEFRNLNSLFGHTISTGETVISNDTGHDPRRGGLPAGHPALNHYLGVPVYYGDKMVGMYGLANRPGGYDENIVDFLQPFNSTYASIIQARSLNIKQQKILAELTQAKDDAIHANLAKSEFLSRMSHELRTPLNAILGFAQLLNTDSGSTQTIKDQSSEILNAGKHLLNLINDVLDLSRIETGNLELSMEEVKLYDILGECLNLIEKDAQQRNIAIHLDSSCHTNSVVHCDHTRLKQVLINLLNNAVKYNRDYGSIIIRCEDSPQSDVIKVSVTDSGRGIPEDRVNEVFESFNRLGAEQTDIEGTGIGLAIAKNIIEKMGGEIGLSSQVGKGATFWFTLNRHIENIPDMGQNISDGTTGSTRTHTMNSEKTVLYIEDNPANLKLVLQLINRLDNIRLLAASRPSEGFEHLKHESIDLILLDINLPEMNGFEVLKKLRNDDNFDHQIPVVAISANAMAPDIEAGLAAGFNDYLTKPFDIPKFIATLETYLGQNP